jgi:hypothetical protein
MEPNLVMGLVIIVVGVVAATISVLSIKSPRSFGFYATIFFPRLLFFTHRWDSWKDVYFAAVGEKKVIREVKILGTLYLFLSLFILIAGVLITLSFIPMRT